MNKGKNKSFLIIDDSEDIHYILERYLSKENITTFSCYNGKEGLDFLNSKENINKPGFPPSTILLDVNMPIMNGFEFLKEFVKIDQLKNINVIMLTSSDLSQDKDIASSFDVVKGYVSKPILKSQIEEILRIA